MCFRGNAVPVIIFDGKREINVGNINIQPTLDYKSFKFVLSEMIKIPPRLISVYLVHPKNGLEIPITGKENFETIFSVINGCFFRVILEQQRKSRNRKGFGPRKSRNGRALGYFSENFSTALFPLAPNVILLQPHPVMKFNCTMISKPIMKEWDSPQIFREAVFLKYKHITCETCNMEEESGGTRTKPFHLCSKDTVTVGFRSKAGPIGPLTTATDFSR